MTSKNVDTNIKNLFFLSWVVVAVAIVAIAFIIEPTDFSWGFWIRVLWIEVLNWLFCKGTEGWFTRYKSNSRTSILPLSDSSTFIYCLISLSLLIYFKQYEAYDSIMKSHAVLQIICLTLYLLISFRIQLAANYADVDIEATSETIESPVYYSEKLLLLEKNIDLTLKASIKRLREKLKYSLMDNNKVRSNKRYKEFILLIEEIISKPEKITEKHLKYLCDMLDELIISIKGKEK